jgi:SOS response regulatory protein OraA/RecX
LRERERAIKQLQERDRVASELEATLANSEQENDALHDIIDRRGKLLQESARKQQESARHHEGIESCLNYINASTCCVRDSD